MMSPWKTFLIAGMFAITSPLMAQADNALNDAQKSEVEQLVRDYILKNPEIVREAILELQRREEVAKLQAQEQMLKKMQADLTSSPLDPVMGNPDGDVTVVEFFDYRCGYCKRVLDAVQTLLKEDGNIRYVLKEFPVLGPESVYASQVAMAVWLHQQDKYQDLHVALLSSRGALNKAKVLDIAEEVGVDVDALKTQLKDPQIAKTMQATRAQAKALDINGTPGFIIGEHIAPGAIPLEAMKEMVALARKK
ncbi:DsbA family protein [Magnetovibrio sp. PR-2]|uniref:DsbA family protein n=1 Tax=Magnetovibrio sp. PR-2 TaxID=3120356 RepID=UPI002FCDF688